MRESRYAEKWIIPILKTHAAGTATASSCLESGKREAEKAGGGSDVEQASVEGRVVKERVRL